jgi:hypothetical protein
MASVRRIAAVAIMALWVGCAHGPKPSETGTLAGKVVDTRGSVIGGARIYLVGTSQVAVTHTDGSFQFRQLLPGVYTVDVGTPSFSTRFSEEIKINPGRVTEVEVVIPAPLIEGTIRGMVVSEDARALRASVFAMGTDRGAYCDSTGRFTFNVAIGTHTVRAVCSGYRRIQRNDVRVSEGDTTTLHFKLTPAPIDLYYPRGKTR